MLGRGSSGVDTTCRSPRGLEDRGIMRGVAAQGVVKAHAMFSEVSREHEQRRSDDP